MTPKLPALVCALAALAASGAAAQTPTPIADRYRDAATRIIQTAQADSAAWHRIATLTDTYGHRLSGSRALEQAIDWILAEMKKDGLDSAWTEPVKIPHWVRGQESAELVAPRKARLHMLGLGMSVGTPKNGITAPVLVVKSFDELTARAADAKGKIVLFNEPWVNYGATVRYRTGGASAAAKVGARAVLIRAVAATSIRSPHTGTLVYDSTVARIPAAALSTEDADMLARMAARGQEVVVTLKMEARQLPDADGRNVLAEIRGTEHPEEVVVLGGHIDSWDVGTGAMDDAGGVVASWEAVRLIQRLGLKPRRTIRVVGWTNEENGGRGGNGYRDAHRAEVDNHILAIESDGGVFAPKGYGATASAPASAMLRDIATLLAPISADELSIGGGGADIGPIMQLGVPGLGLSVEGERYFWYHHSEGDMVDKLDPSEVARCVATLAVMAYVVADMPDRLPRGEPMRRQ